MKKLLNYNKVSFRHKGDNSYISGQTMQSMLFGFFAYYFFPICFFALIVIDNYSVWERIWGLLILIILTVVITLNIKFRIHLQSNQVRIMHAFFGIPYFVKTFTNEEFKIALANYPKNISKERFRIEWEDDPSSETEEWLSFYYDDKEVWTIGNKKNLKQIISYLKEAIGG